MALAIQMLRHTRNLIYSSVKDLSPSQFMEIPTGFDNNIAWNLGHILTVQQRIVYGRSGLPLNISDDMVAMYVPGTSPADWTLQPDSAELIAMVMDQQQQLEDDFKAGKFSNGFEAMTTSTGVPIDDLESGIIFNNYHEGLHLGAILALRNFVG